MNRIEFEEDDEHAPVASKFIRRCRSKVPSASSLKDAGNSCSSRQKRTADAPFKFEFTIACDDADAVKKSPLVPCDSNSDGVLSK